MLLDRRPRCLWPLSPCLLREYPVGLAIADLILSYVADYVSKIYRSIYCTQPLPDGKRSLFWLHIIFVVEVSACVGTDCINDCIGLADGESVLSTHFEWGLSFKLPRFKLCVGLT